MLSSDSDLDWAVEFAPRGHMPAEVLSTQWRSCRCRLGARMAGDLDCSFHLPVLPRISGCLVLAALLVGGSPP